MKLLVTHPPTETRIERLKALAKQSVAEASEGGAKGLSAA